MKSMSFHIVIGAALGASFGTSIMKVSKKLNTVGQKIKDLESASASSQGQLKMVDRFRETKRVLGETSRELEAARENATALGRAIAGTTTPTARQNRELQRARKKVRDLKAAQERQRATLQGLRQEMRGAGIDTRRLGDAHRQAQKQVERHRKSIERLKKAEAGRQAAASKLSGMKARAIGAAGSLYALGRVIGQGADFESAGVRLSTVVNSDDLEASIAKSKAHALAYARKNLASEKEILDIEYALNSAGLDAEAARLGSEVVSEVATITSGAKEQVGEVMATVYNNLGDGLEGTAQEKMARIGDILSKTQAKFQIRDFGQLGESLKYATPALSQYNIKLEQGATLLGVLNSAGLQGGMAGTAFTASLRNMSKASEKLGFEMVRGRDGGLDYVATIKGLSEAIGGFDNMDQATIDQMQKLFGDEGIRAIQAFGKEIGELPEAQEDVTEGSRDFVKSKYPDFLKSTNGQLTMFRNATRGVGIAFAGALLPAVNSVLRPISVFAGKVGEFVQKYPNVSKLIGGAVVGLAAMATVLGIVTVATWAWNAALLANPIGIAVGAIVGAAILVIAAWDPVKTWFGNMWDWIIRKTTSAVDWIVGKLQTVGNWIRKAKGWLVGGDDDDAEDREDETEESLPKPGDAIGKKPKKAAPKTASPNLYRPEPVSPRSSVTPQALAVAMADRPNVREGDVQIHIQTQPNQSTREIAEEVVRQMDEKKGRRLHD